MTDVADLSRWKDFLPTIEMVVNLLPNRSTRYSPFFLMYSYRPILPLELLIGDKSTNVETLSQFLERTQEVWSKTRAQMEKAMAAQKEILRPETQGCAICSWGFSVAEYPELEAKGHSAQPVAEILWPSQSSGEDWDSSIPSQTPRHMENTPSVSCVAT